MQAPVMSYLLFSLALAAAVAASVLAEPPVTGTGASPAAASTQTAPHAPLPRDASQALHPGG